MIAALLRVSGFTWKEALFLKRMTHIFLLTAQGLSSKAHLYGSDNIFPLEAVLFFPHFNLSKSGRLEERKREREGGKVDLHVSTSIQTVRQADIEAWRRAERSSSAFLKIADWLPPVSAQEPGKQAAHIPPSDCSWWNTHVPLSSQHLAHAHSTDPSHSNVLWPTSACQTWAGFRSDTLLSTQQWRFPLKPWLPNTVFVEVSCFFVFFFCILFQWSEQK